MATTDQRAGFRLPWSSDQRPQANETATGAADESAADTAEHGQSETAGRGSADHPSTETHSMSADAPTDAFASAPGSLSGKRPTKFLADLTRAMQAAAEEARTQTLTQLQADAKAFIEEIHTRSASDVTDLRKEADDDVAGIRDWSKAEIARIREETEVRITDRKAELEGQLERHAGVIEREIERIQGQVSAFEGEMAYFFEELLVEQDPTKFAVMAENLPEPPRFQARMIDFRALAAQAAASAVVAEPADKPRPAASETVEADVEDRRDGFVAAGPAFETADREDADFVKAKGVAELVAETDAPDHATDYADPWRDTRTQASGKAGSVETTDDKAESVETTAGKAESLEPADRRAESVETSDGAKGSTDEASTAPDGEMGDLEMSAFDAAEAEAAAAAGTADAVATADDEIATMSDDALAARLAGLVPDRAPTEQRPPKSAAASTTTQVVVVGLVSVASIASFKRHLGRIPGVQSVGVSSGPDGEFVFAVNHAEDVSLREVVPTVPGFQARVTNAGDGVVNVTAHDPESDG
jgi:hypothetical protein